MKVDSAGCLSTTVNRMPMPEGKGRSTGESPWNVEALNYAEDLCKLKSDVKAVTVARRDPALHVLPPCNVPRTEKDGRYEPTKSHALFSLALRQSYLIVSALQVVVH